MDQTQTIDPLVAKMQDQLKSNGYTPPSVSPASNNDWHSQIKAHVTPNPSPNGIIGGAVVDTGKNIAKTISEGADKFGAIPQDTHGEFIEKPLSLLSTAGHVAGDVAGGVGDIFSRLLSPLVPQEIKDKAPEASNAIGEWLNKNIPGMSTVSDYVSKNPDVLKGLTDVINTLSLYGGGKVAPEVAGAVKTGAEAITPTLEKGVTSATDLANAAKEKVIGTPAEIADKNLQKLVEETSGVADKKARISALENTGATTKEGKPLAGTEQSLLGGIKTTADSMALERAKSVEGIIKPGASPVENLTNINREISRISEKEIGPALEKAGNVTPISDKAPGWSSIVQRMKDIEKPDIIKADSTLNKTYDLVRNRMIEQIQKQPPTVKGLWDARKAFDQVVKDQFGDVAFNSEKNTAIKRAISDMRRTVNNIIGERVPQYKPQMNKLSGMYDARYNIAEQFQDLVNKGGVKAFVKLNPKKAALLKWGGGLAGYETVKHTVAPFLPGI